MLTSGHKNGLGKSNATKLLATVCGLALTTLLLFTFIAGSSEEGGTLGPRVISLAHNPHNQFPPKWRPEPFVSSELLLDTPFLKVESHKLDYLGQIIEDWIWVDTPNVVNVLLKDGDRYMVLKHKKYGYTGESYAVIGGHVEEGETPLEAGMREVQEELGIVALDPSSWLSVGAYRTDVNRGMGTTYCYLALGPWEKAASTPEEDLEHLDLVYLSEDELIEVLVSGQMKEVRWTAAAAVAVLKQQQRNN
jgi:8-oxo-dGTP pyrophosphatase MutT (NUDIX family)